MDGWSFLLAKVIRLSLTSQKKDNRVQALYNHGSETLEVYNEPILHFNMDYGNFASNSGRYILVVRIKNDLRGGNECVSYVLCKNKEGL